MTFTLSLFFYYFLFWFFKWFISLNWFSIFKIGAEVVVISCGYRFTECASGFLFYLM